MGEVAISNFENTTTSRAKLIEWVYSNSEEWNIWGNLLTKEHISSDYVVKKAMMRWGNIVDKVFYGNLPHRKNIRVERIVFYQRGKRGVNPHAHFIAKSPNPNVVANIELLKTIWERCIYVSSAKGFFEIAKDNYAIADYITREFPKLKNDTFEVFTTHINENVELPTYNASTTQMAIVRRMLKLQNPSYQYTNAE